MPEKPEIAEIPEKPNWFPIRLINNGKVLEYEFSCSSCGFDNSCSKIRNHTENPVNCKDSKKRKTYLKSLEEESEVA